MAKQYATPGVYIEEKSAFSNSVVSVATAVPAFIGYTQKAAAGKKDLTNVPMRITSMVEFLSFFGGAPTTKFTVEADGDNYSLAADEGTNYNLFRSMQLFFANGGGASYVVSVGNYGAGVKASALIGAENGGGITALLKEQEPTLVVIPDAVLLEEGDCATVQQAMIKHCGADTRSRFAILDVWGGHQARTLLDDDVVTAARTAYGGNFLDFGAAYYPWLNATVVSSDDLSYVNISNPEGLVDILNNEVDENVSAGYVKAEKGDMIKEEIAKISDDEANTQAVSNLLKAVSPIYNDVLGQMKDTLNVLPPSGAIAGIYALVDSSVGVHKAPANVSVSAITGPTVNITAEEQENLNLPLNGKAVNAIRPFVGKGTLVWGARTLDGNSGDWRYINVRRTMIMLEQSIKFACEPYVFRPNDTNTWLSVRTMISNFLRNQWQSGALVGASEDEAYLVECGLGITMTPQDVLDGYMKVTVKVAISRPAEFIVITFQQKMPGGE
ncbi:phage tail sheath family protein [Aureispira anguillae]|uniref:Phage tail sheath subtilisin-like domain-containing protein n=1 Tax=Aureispira anguillae TaxID=2864201 RepID=A0A916DV51_9BACT|nr:phage tail sheath C-terminal domain-containing protein [Aureispira anguillae]BDS14001.1 phage tail sheath subtilisin-like domain-containing protein [Aureispira anguillae]